MTGVKGGNRKILAQIPYQYLICYTLNHLTFSSISFLICKMGTGTVPSPCQDSRKVSQGPVCEAPRRAPREAWDTLLGQRWRQRLNRGQALPMACPSKLSALTLTLLEQTVHPADTLSKRQKDS